MKATALVHPDIALIKYWGKRESREKERLPVNGSIAMNLSALQTITTVEFHTKYLYDVVKIDGTKVKERSYDRVVDQLNRIRSIAKMNYFARVDSINNFPSDTGISSSGSGFAALTVAGVKAAGLSMTKRELSILARQGSGSACRPINDGFTEWIPGNSDMNSYAKTLYPADWWKIYDVITIISYEKKTIPTTEGMRRAKTSLFFKKRISNIQKKIKELKRYIRIKDFDSFGKLIESEALEMHAIALTSNPPLLYWLPQTVEILHAVYKMRFHGIQAYFTLNTGQNVHIFTQQHHLSQVERELKKYACVKKIIINKPSEGARYIDNHLF